MKLKELYENSQNPLDKKETIQNLVEIYRNSSRTISSLSSNSGAIGGMYKDLISTSKIADTSVINQKSKEKFLVNYYNSWIKSISNLTEQEIIDFEKKYKFNIRPLKSFLSDTKKVSSLKDINNILKNPIIKNNKMAQLELFSTGWEHIKSRYVSGKQENSINVNHRIYLNSKMSNIYDLINEFRLKCENLGIPYYFKFNTDQKSDGREDIIVIYSDSEHLTKYIEILQQIKKEHPKYAYNCNKPPILTSVYDGWMGIADEPEKNFDKSFSFNKLRALVIEEGIEQTILNNIKKFKNTNNFIVNKKSMSFNDVFRNLLAKECVEYKNLKNLSNKELGTIVDEISSQLTSSALNTCLSKINEVKDKRHLLLSSNLRSIYKISTSKGDIDLNIDIIDKSFRKLVPLLINNNPHFYDEVKQNITQRSQRYLIDSNNFAFNISTRHKFLNSPQTDKKNNSFAFQGTNQSISLNK